MLTDARARDVAGKIQDGLIGAEQRANVVVVGQFGEIRCLLRMINTRPFTVGVAWSKAEQSAHTGRRTRYIAEQVEKGELTAAILGIAEDKLIRWPGGVPIYNEHGILVGGAGVSNLTGDEDEQFCIAGVEGAGFVSERK